MAGEFQLPRRLSGKGLEVGRIRTIKPEFPQSESIGRISRDARLLFIELWTIADDAGRSRGSSRLLASLLYPYDKDAPELMPNWLAELERENMIVLYEIGGTTYLQICNFLKHQKIDHAGQSRIPEFIESSRILARTSETLAPDLVSRTLTLDLGKSTPTPSLLTLEPLEPKLKSKRRTKASILDEFPPDTRNAINAIIDMWPKMRKGNGSSISISTPQLGYRVDLIVRENPGVTPDTLVKAAEWYLSEPDDWRKAPQYFFGVGGGDKANWTAYAKMVNHRKATGAAE
jgi:hypothetical protein